RHALPSGLPHRFFGEADPPGGEESRRSGGGPGGEGAYGTIAPVARDRLRRGGPGSLPRLSGQCLGGIGPFGLSSSRDRRAGGSGGSGRGPRKDRGSSASFPK